MGVLAAPAAIRCSNPSARANRVASSAEADCGKTAGILATAGDQEIDNRANRPLGVGREVLAAQRSRSLAWQVHHHRRVPLLPGAQSDQVEDVLPASISAADDEQRRRIRPPGEAQARQRRIAKWDLQELDGQALFAHGSREGGFVLADQRGEPLTFTRRTELPRPAEARVGLHSGLGGIARLTGAGPAIGQRLLGLAIRFELDAPAARIAICDSRSDEEQLAGVQTARLRHSQGPLEDEVHVLIVEVVASRAAAKRPLLPCLFGRHVSPLRRGSRAIRLARSDLGRTAKKRPAGPGPGLTAKRA